MKKYSSEWWSKLSPSVAGKEVEHLAERALNNLKGVWWHRFPDSKSARNWLPPQPADYVVVGPGKTVFLEVKGVKSGGTLAVSRVPQLPTLNKLVAAGGSATILVHKYMDGLWIVLDPGALQAGARSFPLTKQTHTYASAEEALASIWNSYDETI